MARYKTAHRLKIEAFLATDEDRLDVNCGTMDDMRRYYSTAFHMMRFGWPIEKVETNKVAKIVTIYKKK